MQSLEKKLHQEGTRPYQNTAVEFCSKSLINPQDIGITYDPILTWRDSKPHILTLRTNILQLGKAVVGIHLFLSSSRKQFDVHSLKWLFSNACTASVLHLFVQRTFYSLRTVWMNGEQKFYIIMCQKGLMLYSTHNNLGPPNWHWCSLSRPPLSLGLWIE